MQCSFYNILELVFNICMHHEIYKIEIVLNYRYAGKDFEQCGGRWGLKGGHVKVTSVLSNWTRVLPYSNSRVLAFNISFCIVGWWGELKALGSSIIQLCTLQLLYN